MRRTLLLGPILLALPLLAPLASQPSAQAVRQHTPTPRGMDQAPMVRVEAGPFQLGADSGGDPDEGPRHTAQTGAFWIDVHEVTNAQYKRFCSETGHKPPVQWKSGAIPAGKENWPVVNVSWEDAWTYAKWAGKRLPTEKEWEKAARGTDGREYPWGREADKTKSALGDEKALGPVGRFPAGSSPYGCQDMSGNAWEWTADWYGPYSRVISDQSSVISSQHAIQSKIQNPKSRIQMVMTAVYAPNSIHFGKKYKVIRGGGAIEYYGIPNTGRVSDRARALPFTGYDGTGFRCVMDDESAANTAAARNDASEALVTVQPMKTAAVAPRSPVVLTVSEPAGVARTKEIVTSGVPFPEGVLKSAANVRLLDDKGAEVPLQTAVTGTWKDKSVKWLLLDFPCAVGSGQTRRYRLEWGPNVRRKVASATEKKAADEYFLTQPPTRGIKIDVDGKSVEQSTVASGEKAGKEMVYEYTGRTVRKERIDRSDWVTQTFASIFSLTARTTGPVGGPHQTTSYSLRQVSDKPILNVTRWDIPLLDNAEIESVVFGGGHKFPVKAGDRFELLQENEYRYTVRRNGKAVAGGTRSPGWVTVNLGDLTQTFAVRDFWQQFPMAITVEPARVVLRAWAGKEPLDFDRGMAKTVEVLTADGGPSATGSAVSTAFQKALFATASPEWYCRSGALGDLWPYDIDRFPAYETPVEADLDRWMRNRPYGWRNWGDAYMGGPYKGKNAYNNLEYDVPYDFAMQFFRNGHRKYLEAMAAGARHQSDIDTNHITGQPWKHSPRHTETPAELGHVFLRGLIAYTHLTGDTRGLETAKEIALWVSRAIRRSSEYGNERQIGWALYALTGTYEATWDQKLLDATKDFVDTLIDEQEPTGKFAIRYDNRIAFFNGLAMAGLRRYHELTGDDKVLIAIQRLADRTLGMYPEYAGRTIDGYTWLHEKTRDPRYATAAVRSWETTLEYAQVRDWGPATTLFATRYLPWAVRNGLAPDPEKPLKLTPAQLSTHNGLYLTRVEFPAATVYLSGLTDAKADVIIVRHGAHSSGLVGLMQQTSEAAKPKGRAVPLPVASKAAQQATVASGVSLNGTWKLTLQAEGTKAWDVITTKPAKRMVVLPSGGSVHRLVPRVYFQAAGPTLTANFEAEGEGFHGAVLYDSSGKPVKASTRFIDQGDTKKYAFTLTAPIPAKQRGHVWSMDIQESGLTSLTGAKQEFTTSRAAFFIR